MWCAEPVPLLRWKSCKQPLFHRFSTSPNYTLRTRVTNVNPKEEKRNAIRASHPDRIRLRELTATLIPSESSVVRTLDGNARPNAVLSRGAHPHSKVQRCSSRFAVQS